MDGRRPALTRISIAAPSHQPHARRPTPTPRQYGTLLVRSAGLKSPDIKRAVTAELWAMLERSGEAGPTPFISLSIRANLADRASPRD
jgi:hypothetical protein